MSTDSFDRAILKAELTTDEGREGKVYFDTLGIPTIGIGRNLRDVGLRDDEIDHLFNNDVDACATVMDEHIGWWRTLPPPQQRAMIDLCFMGWARFAEFVHFLAAMQRGDWPGAAAELENSRWWTQVGERGPRVRARLLGTSTEPYETDAAPAATTAPAS